MADATIIARPTATRQENQITARIPEKWITLSRHGWPAGDTHGNYANTHAAGYAYIKGCARAGVTWDDAFRELRRGALYDTAWGTKTTSKGKRRTLTPQDAEDRCHKDWAKAVKQVANNPLVVEKVGARHAIAVLRETARHHPWKGRSALRDKIVLNAILDAGMRLETLHPTVSLRTLCETTPYRNFRTIRLALQSLTALGWVRVDRTDCDRNEPSAIYIREPLVSYPQDDPYPTHRADRGEPLLGTDRPPPVVPIRPAADSDKCRLAMVTSTRGQAVYAALWEKAQSRNQVAARAGVCRETTSRWLPKLAKLGLAVEEPNGWVIGDRDPVDVASKWGADMVELDRKDLHAEQRNKWQEKRGIYAAGEARAEKTISEIVARRREDNVHKCVATTKRGDLCPTGADEWGLCHIHDPDGVYGTNHPAYRDRMLAQLAIRDAWGRRAEAAAPRRAEVPPVASRRGPETRASAVNPEAWAEIGGTP